VRRFEVKKKLETATQLEMNVLPLLLKHLCMCLFTVLVSLRSPNLKAIKPKPYTSLLIWLVHRRAKLRVFVSIPARVKNRDFCCPTLLNV